MTKLQQQTLLAFVLLLSTCIDRAVDAEDARNPLAPARLFFTSPLKTKQGEPSQSNTGIVNADGSGLRYVDSKVPGQATWQPGRGARAPHRLHDRRLQEIVVTR